MNVLRAAAIKRLVTFRNYVHGKQHRTRTLPLPLLCSYSSYVLRLLYVHVQYSAVQCSTVGSQYLSLGCCHVLAWHVAWSRALRPGSMSWRVS